MPLLLSVKRLHRPSNDSEHCWNLKANSLKLLILFLLRICTSSVSLERKDDNSIFYAKIYQRLFLQLSVSFCFFKNLKKKKVLKGVCICDIKLWK